MKYTKFVLMTIVSTLISILSLSAYAEEREINKLFKDAKVFKQIKQINTISDNDYDSLRKLVLAKLVEDKLVSINDFSYSDIGLGYKEFDNQLLVESKNESKNRLRLFVFPDRTEVDAIYGGEKFAQAFQSYVTSFGGNDLQSQLSRVGIFELNLAYLLAVMNKEITPLALDLDKYEAIHDKTKVISSTLQYGARKDQKWHQLQFNEKGVDYTQVSGPGVYVDNFGTIRFIPHVKVGRIQSDTATGSCIRKICGATTEVECLENTTNKSCESQEAFGGQVRCKAALFWNQNLKCPMAKQIITKK